jgi:uncharacterized lipoprotein YddW (UPF0748 family)
MKQRLTLLPLMFIFCMTVSAQLKREVRAVWLTVNHNLDWPRSSAAGKSEIEQQKAALDRMLDKLKDANINLVFFQTRIRGSVIYPSKIEPFTELIKSKYCSENFDALQYAIDACHSRGMELHAWFVAYPLGKNLDKTSKTLSQSDIAVKFKNEWYINPGNPKTTPYLLSLIRETVSKYNIDGIHFDYIRYPDGSAKFPDSKEYLRYGHGQSLAAWRRGNINRFVYAVYDAVKELKPWVSVSSSVVGMYDRLPEVDRRHWTAYNSVYQDPVDWVRKGKHDFIVPMLYNRDNLFFPFVKDWIKRCGEDKVVPGLGIYMMNEAGWTPDVITEQIRYLRENDIPGCAFFRVRNLTENEIFYRQISSNYFSAPALLPTLTAANQPSPEHPGNFYAEGRDNYLYLSWTEPSNVNNVFYNLYRSETFPVDTDNPENLIAVKLNKPNCKIRINNRQERVYYYAVTAYDRYHSESKASEQVLFVSSEFEK